jgi:hypothetical protein
VSVIASDRARNAVERAAKPRRFWQRFAQALDRLVVNRTKRSVPDVVLRRSKLDVDRCRRLMLQSQGARGQSGSDRFASQSGAQAIKTRR